MLKRGMIILALTGLCLSFALKAYSIQSANTFKYIAQPLTSKAIVTLTGVSIIGLELWWFLYRPKK